MHLRLIGLLFITIGILSSNSAVAMSAPDFAAFSAVPQLWSWPDRLVIAPDRRWLASMSNEGRTIQIIDNASGTILRTIENIGERDPDRHNPPPAGIAITDDSTIVVVRLDDGTRRAWNVITGQQLTTAPADIAFIQRPITPEESVAVQGAYRIAVAMDQEGTEAISIASGSRTIDPIHFRIPKSASCGGGAVANAIFDGQELVFSLSSGDALPEDARRPAIAFELANGQFRELWQAPCEQEFFPIEWIPAKKPLLGIGGDIGIAPVEVWNLAENRMLTRFPISDGLAAASFDGKTIVTSSCDGDPAFARISVLHHGRRASIKCPRKSFNRLFVSPDGAWLAVSSGSSTSVWSLSEGIKTAERQVEAVGISDAGRIFERKTPPDEYHGHEIIDRWGDGRWLVTDEKFVFDTRSGAVVADYHQPYSEVKDISKMGLAIVLNDGALRAFDLNTGRLRWSVQATVNTPGYVMTFPDGCVQVSPGAERFVRLVRGFKNRAFDTAARVAFAKPTCKGTPVAVAKSEAAYEADRAHVAALAQSYAEEEARKTRDAEAMARRDEAARRTWIAGAPEREAEARRAATMVTDATITFDLPDRAEKQIHGKVAWHLSKGANDADAVGVVTVPDLDFETILAIDEATASEPKETGVIGLLVQLKPGPNRAVNLSVRTISLSRGTPSIRPMHIPLHWDGPSGLSMISRFDPPSGKLQLADLQPSTWIDVPLVLSNGKPATLSIAIGTPGRQLIDQVIAFKRSHPAERAGSGISTTRPSAPTPATAPSP